MPDLGDVLTSPPPPPPGAFLLPVLYPCTAPIPWVPFPETLDLGPGDLMGGWDHPVRGRILTRAATAAIEACNGEGIDGAAEEVEGFKKGRGRRRVGNAKSLEGHVRDWVQGRMRSGFPERDCALPFLCNTPRMVECRLCKKCIYPDEEVVCSVRDCQGAFHRECANGNGFSKSTNFKCPQHVCFICKQTANWRCIRCTMAAHTKCSPWPDDVIYVTSQHRRAICWRHPMDWRVENEQYAVPTSDVEEAFRRLPLPYINEEFRVDTLLKDVMETETAPTPYVHIKRNIYLVKKKRDDADVGTGCTNCNFQSTCIEDCECRCQSVSCSKSCRCSDLCTNRPFRKEKKIKIVKTQFCGWGVEALEAIKNGEYIIEYVGEVIDDAQCEQRLWDMEHRGDQKFYMCEIRKDFTIDATFKGNASRFLNHSCDPNCELDKWQVEGETRVGVFASRNITAGEPLTYDYRFVHFGSMVKCHCGASNCQGYLGSKKKSCRQRRYTRRKRYSLQPIVHL